MTSTINTQGIAQFSLWFALAYKNVFAPFKHHFDINWIYNLAPF